MNPREKAKELAEFYKNYVRAEWVIIVTERCIDEIIESFNLYGNDLDMELEYWQQVKQELNKL